MITLTPAETERFWAGVDRSGPGCWPWTRETNRHGYGRFTVYRNGRRIRLLTHRLAYQLTHEVELGEQKARHQCDNPPCCNPACILPGTQRDNVHDAISRGRVNVSGLALGTPHRSAVLAAALARGVRRCSTCREERPLDEFHRSRSQPGGRGYCCRGCCSATKGRRRALLRRRATLVAS